MFRVYTESGSVYTFDDENKRVIRQNDSVPLVMLTGKDVDDVTGNWRTYESWRVSSMYVGDHLMIFFPEGDYVYSTSILRMENLVPVG